MADVQLQQGGAADSSDPLLDSSILHNVLSYVGPGHFLFVAAVSKWWKEIYATLKSQQVPYYASYRASPTITCGPQMTLYSSVFESHSRVRVC
jgi:hypothetical protein